MRTNSGMHQQKVLALGLVILLVVLAGCDTPVPCVSGGTGTAEDPYIICTIEELQAIGESEASRSACYRLGCDINASATAGWNGGAGFIPIGFMDLETEEETPFTGSFDGDGHVISNLYINTSETVCVGLIGFLGEGGTVQGLGLKSVHVTAAATGEGLVVGGLVGASRGTVTDCYVSGEVSGEITATEGKTGFSSSIFSAFTGRRDGKSAWEYQGEATCKNAAEGEEEGENGEEGEWEVGEGEEEVTPQNKESQLFIGGLVGMSQGVLTDSDANSTVNGVAGEYDVIYIGGLVGAAAGTLMDAYATGKVTARPGAEGGAVAGGLVGWNANGAVSGCYAAGEVSITGEDAGGGVLGGLVGFHEGGALENCYATGAVNATGIVAGRNTLLGAGGLVGSKRDAVTHCSASGPVTVTATITDDDGGLAVGGLVGRNSDALSYCYATGAVSVTAAGAYGEVFAGGLLGYNGCGAVTDCYAIGDVSGTGNAPDIGGLVGYNTSCTITWNKGTASEKGAWDAVGACGAKAALRSDGAIMRCYAAGKVSGEATGSEEVLEIGGLVGDISRRYDHEDRIRACFWDVETSGSVDWSGDAVEGDEEDIEATGLTTAEMMDPSTFRDAGWDLGATWAIDGGAGYPYLRSWEAGLLEGDGSQGNPFLIHSLEELQRINLAPSKSCFKLMNDIDASDTAGWGKGFTPITLNGGLFDGGGHVIKNLYINRPEEQKTGFFASVTAVAPVEESPEDPEEEGGKNTGRLTSATPDGLVQDLGLENVDITGGSYVGGLAGSLSGTILNCYVTGVVAGDGAVGGLVGSGGGVVTASHAMVDVTGTGTGYYNSNRLGGLVGSLGSGVVTNCYATGDVAGKGIALGGLIGTSDSSSSSIEGCYATGDVSLTQTETDSYPSVGGLSGNNWASMTNCSASGAVTVTSTSEYSKVSLGGLVGRNSGALTACSATGSVLGEDTRYIGGLIGWNLDNADLTDCSATGAVRGEGTGENSSSVGGFIGRNEKNTVSACSASGDVTGVGIYSYVGGFAGHNSGALTKCSATGAVVAEVMNCGAIYAGGLIGWNDENTANACFASGDVSGAVTGAYEYTRRAYVGGLMGVSQGALTACYATGSALGSVEDANDEVHVGGLVGDNRNGAVTGCYATGALSGAGTGNWGEVCVGGLIGNNNEGAIIACYATGALSGAGTGERNAVCVGGLVGNNADGEVTRCYAAGAVNGTETGEYNTVYAGGISGRSEYGAVVTACFWDVTRSGIAASAEGEGEGEAEDEAADEGAVGLTTAEMLHEAEFVAAGWDFTEVWSITPGATYPWLQSLDYSEAGYPAP